MTAKRVLVCSWLMAEMLIFLRGLHQISVGVVADARMPLGRTWQVPEVSAFLQRKRHISVDLHSIAKTVLVCCRQVDDGVPMFLHGQHRFSVIFLARLRIVRV